MNATTTYTPAQLRERRLKALTLRKVADRELAEVERLLKAAQQASTKQAKEADKLADYVASLVQKRRWMQPGRTNKKPDA